MPTVDPGARALPGGPVRGAARAARAVPRRRPGHVLQRAATSGRCPRTRTPRARPANQPPYYVLAAPAGRIGQPAAVPADVADEGQQRRTCSRPTSPSTAIRAELRQDDRAPGAPGRRRPGPEQIANSTSNHDGHPRTSRCSTAASANVIHGNLLTLPIGQLVPLRRTAVSRDHDQRFLSEPVEGPRLLRRPDRVRRDVGGGADRLPARALHRSDPAEPAVRQQFRGIVRGQFEPALDPAAIHVDTASVRQQPGHRAADRQGDPDAQGRLCLAGSGTVGKAEASLERLITAIRLSRAPRPRPSNRAARRHRPRGRPRGRRRDARRRRARRPAGRARRPEAIWSGRTRFATVVSPPRGGAAR